MSGIAGIFRPSDDRGGADSAERDESDVRRMLDAMPHRGPDGRSVWSGPSVALGHAMLHATPESLREQLPRESGTLVLTADARIDNRDALRPVLGLSGDAVDSEFILAAYHRWGDACTEHLLGAYAFAIWDADARRLVLARDHLGVNPVYYATDRDGAFVFASEIKALLALPAVDEIVDDFAFVEAFTRERTRPEGTLFRGIRQVLAGHRLVVDVNGVSAGRYWHPEVYPAITGLSDEEYATRFREHFREAVRCRMRTVRPVASELSGGLDSTFVTCVARDLLREAGSGPLRTISLVYEHHPECDERRFIEPVVAQGGLDARYVTADEVGLFELLDDIYDYLDDGRAGGMHHLNWLSLRSAKEAGAGVVLTGTDGDTTVYHGWEYFRELARGGRWAQFADEARRCLANLSAEREVYAMQEAPFTSVHDIVNAYVGAILHDQVRSRQYLSFVRSVEGMHRHLGISRGDVYRRFRGRLLRSLRPGGTAPPGLRSASLPPLLDARIARAYLADAPEIVRDEQMPDLPLREIQRDRLLSPKFSAVLDKFNHYAAAHGIEARHPFMDVRLIEFCLRLPPEQSLSGGRSRAIMRRAMEGIVPDVVRTRAGKTALGPSFLTAVARDEDAVRSTVAEAGRTHGLVDAASAERLFEAVQRGEAEPASTLGVGLSLVYWLKKRDLTISPPPQEGVSRPLEAAHS